MIATIHSAIHLSHIDYFMFDDDCDVCEKDQESIIIEINKIADKLSKGESMNIGSTEDIIKYVRNKF